MLQAEPFEKIILASYDIIVLLLLFFVFCMCVCVCVYVCVCVCVIKTEFIKSPSHVVFFFSSSFSHIKSKYWPLSFIFIFFLRIIWRFVCIGYLIHAH